MGYEVKLKIKYLLNSHPFYHEIRFLLILKFCRKSFIKNLNINNIINVNDIPQLFNSIVAELSLDESNSFEASKKIVAYLSKSKTKGGTFSNSSIKVMKSYIKGIKGVCSDCSQIFSSICIAGNILVREWGVCDCFVDTSFGHVMNEIYSTEYKKWVLIDPEHTVYFTLNNYNEPLSLTEVVDIISYKDDKNIIFNYIDQDKKANDNYYIENILNRNNIFFLLSNYHVFKQDKILKYIDIVPIPIAHFIMYKLGIYQKFNIYINNRNVINVRNKHKQLIMKYKKLLPILKLVSNQN